MLAPGDARARGGRTHGSARRFAARTVSSTERRSGASSSPTRPPCVTSRRSSTLLSGRGSLARSRRPRQPARRAVVVEAIKLVEGGLRRAVRRGLAGHLRPGTQRERLVGRGDAADDADARIAAQGDLAARSRRARRGSSTRAASRPRRGRASTRCSTTPSPRMARHRAAARTTRDGGPGGPEARRVSGARSNVAARRGPRRGSPTVTPTRRAMRVGAGCRDRRRLGRRRPAPRRREGHGDRQPVADDDPVGRRAQADASTFRVSTSGRSARLNCAVPLACRCEISSATSSGALST